MRKTDLDMLCRAKLFAGLPREKVAELAGDGGERCRFGKGAHIYGNEEGRSALGVLVAGEAVVSKTGTGGRHLIVSTLTGGDLFGMATLFDETACFPTEIRAKSACTVYFFSRARVEELFRAEPHTAANYIAVLSARIRFLTARLEGLTGGDATEKLCGYLATIAQAENGLCRAHLPYSMTELTSVLDVSRASLYRAWRELTEAGILRRSGREITILQPQRLQNE